jgi:O-antigen/teichoic acid export membrane protein
VIRPGAIKERIEARLAMQGKLGAVLVKGVLGTAGLRAASGAIGFVTAIVLAKLLGPSDYGTYSFVVALVGFLTIPSEFGLPKLAIREIAFANARKQWGLMRGFIIRAHQGIAVLTVVLLLVGVAALLTWGRNFEAVKRECMWLGLALVPLVSLGALRGAMLRGLRKVVYGQIPEMIVRPLALLLIVVFLSQLGRNMQSPVAVMGAQVAAVTTAFVVGLIMFLRHRPPELLTAEPQFRTRAWLASTIPFALTAMLQLINGKLDVVLLGVFREHAEVGIYRVASQFGVFVIFGLQVVNAIQGPHIAHLFAKGDMERLQVMVTKSARAICSFAVPSVLVLVAFGPGIIRLAFGEQYLAAYVPMVILCAGQLVNSALGSVASLLNMTGNEKDVTRTFCIGAAVNVVLNATLTPTWGAVGAAIATSATLIVWNLIMCWLVWRRTGINSSPFFRLRARRA